MAEFFNVLPPDEALRLLLEQLRPEPEREVVRLSEGLGRVTAEPIHAPSDLPAFPRSSMDGYAVRARDTYGTTPSLPAFLSVVGEVRMGRAPAFSIEPAQAAVVHTGGMIPEGADAVVMVENTQVSRESEIEVVRPAAPGENVLRVGEDIRAGQEVFPAGHWLRAQDLGGLAGLGVAQVAVAKRPRVAILATGDEVVPPEKPAGPGQVHDVNSFTVAGLAQQAGGEPVPRGIIADDYTALLEAASRALSESEVLVLSAGSSVSVRDMTSAVINELGPPGVLVHGVAVKPGKPTILAASGGKPVLGLPGNPVSALLVADLFLTPLLLYLLGCRNPPLREWLRARVTRNLDSEAGREDYVPARLEEREGELWAEPVFGKSNLIFTLINAHGVIRVPLNTTGLAQGEWADVRRF